MAIPTIVGVGADNSGTTGAVTYAWPASYTPTAGDVAYLICETNVTGGLTAPSGGWAHITNSPRAQGSNVVSLSVFELVLAGGESAPQVPGASDHQSGFVIVFRGCDVSGGSPIDFTPVGSGNAAGSNMSATGGTTTVADCLVVVCSANSTDSASDQYSAISNGSLANLAIQNQAPTTSGNGGGSMVATGEKATAGATGTTTATVAAGATANLVFALKPATSSPVSLDVDPAILTLSGVEAAMSGTGSASLDVDPATLVLSGQDAALSGVGAASMAVDSASLSLTGVEASFSTGAGGPVTFDVDPAVLSLTAVTPTFSGAGSATMVVEPATLTLAGQTLSLAGTGSASLLVDPAVLTLTGQTPTLTGAGSASVAVDPAVLNLVGQEVALSGAGSASLAVPPALLSLVGVTPDMVSDSPDTNPITLTVRPLRTTATVPAARCTATGTAPSTSTTARTTT